MDFTETAVNCHWNMSHDLVLGQHWRSPSCRYLFHVKLLNQYVMNLFTQDAPKLNYENTYNSFAPRPLRSNVL